jgi:FabA-like domain
LQSLSGLIRNYAVSIFGSHPAPRTQQRNRCTQERHLVRRRLCRSLFWVSGNPGALLIECLAQAGTALLEVSLHYGSKALLIAVDQTKFRSLVRPGDQLRVSMKMISLYEDSAQMDGEVRVGERLMMNGKLTFGLKDAGEFYSDKTRFIVESIYEIWLKDAELIGS